MEETYTADTETGTREAARGLVVAGLSGGSGKSVFSVGLAAALRERDGKVAPFKKGPDYIDAGWLGLAAGRPCYNLDPYLMPAAAIAATCRRQSRGCDFTLVEGNRGLFDGVNPEGDYSTAELALLLGLPVLLVVNCAKMTRTTAALVLGCRAFDPRLHIAGVLLNQIATPRHEDIIRKTMERYTELPVLGAMPRMKKDIFPMRHLGVTPLQEYAEADEAVAGLAAMVREHCDLDAILAVMSEAALPEDAAVEHAALEPPAALTIGVLRDAAFQFYYEENLDALRAGGARLVMIDALSASGMPEGLDGLYIGGGFPETSARRLAENSAFRQSLRQAIKEGLPVYAECGGLIFLGRSIRLHDQEYPLVDIFPVTFSLSSRPQAHGYSSFLVEGNNSFYPKGTRIRGHEFRYSLVEQWDGRPEELACRMERGTGFAGGRDGLVHKNVLALYTHVLAPGTPEWAPGFLAVARRHQRRRTSGLHKVKCFVKGLFRRRPEQTNGAETAPEQEGKTA